METKKKAKRAVAAAKQEAYENIYRKLDTKNEKMLYIGWQSSETEQPKICSR